MNTKDVWIRAAGRLTRFALPVAVAVMSATTVPAQDNWPRFRGEGAMGVAPDNPDLPETWSTTKNVAWKTGIPGMGWSSPVTWGDNIFLTTAVDTVDYEPPKKGLYFRGERPEMKEHPHEWWTYCIDLRDGSVKWKKMMDSGVPEFGRHLKNSYASETPVTDGSHVYVYIGNVGLVAYDFEGGEVWKREFEPVRTRFNWGSAASPVLHGDRLYVINDNEDQSWLAALDKRTGKEIWRVDREEGSNWAPPYVWENELRTEIVTPGTNWTRSYDTDGNLLWKLTGMSSITIANPFSKFGLLYTSSGYVGDHRRPVFAIKPGASGDISIEKGTTSSEFIAWCDHEAAPYNPSPILYGDYFYVLQDRGFFTCHYARTGKMIYDKQRIEKGANAFTSSPWAYNGKIFCLSEDGDTYVIRAGADFSVTDINPLGEMCMATPAIARGSLIIRGAQNLWCIRKGAGEKTTSSAD